MPSVGMIDAADLVGVGMDVDEPLARRGDAEQRVALRRRLRHAAADQQHEIGRFDPRLELRIDGDADLAGEIGMVAVDDARAAERAATGRSKRSANRAKAALARSVQPPPPTMTIGRFAAHSIFCSSAICVWPGQIGAGSTRGASATRGHFGQHVLGQRDRRPGRAAPASRCGTRAGRSREGARRISICGRPFGGRAEEGAIVHLLEGAAAASSRARPGR